MDDQHEKLPAELREKLLEVELAAEAEERKLAHFDRSKATVVGLTCLGLGFTLGIALRQGVLPSVGFGVFMGLAGFVTAGFQKAKKQ